MKKLLYITLFFLAVSCVKSGGENSPESLLKVDVVMEQATSIGIFIYHSEMNLDGSLVDMTEFELYSERYRNIKAVYDSEEEKWGFVYKNSTTIFDDLCLLQQSEGTALGNGYTVLAYAPWIENATSISEIPFTLGGTPDLVKDVLWARQNTLDMKNNPTDSGSNYNIVPDGDDKTILFNFQHAFSMVRIGVRSQEDGSLRKLSSVTLRRADNGKTSLPVSGKVNAMTGEVENVALSHFLTYDFSNSESDFQSASDYVYFTMLICPQMYNADGDYVIECEVDGNKIPSVYEIKISDVSSGFNAGEVYTFEFTIGKDMAFDKAYVSTEWVYDSE